MGLSDGTKLISLDFSSLDDCSSLSPAFGFVKTPAILCVEKEEGEEEEEEEEEQQQQPQQQEYIYEVCLKSNGTGCAVRAIGERRKRGLCYHVT